MRDVDQAVDKVMKRLGSVEAPEGMEGRVLLAMQRHAAKPGPTGWQGLWRIVPGRAGVMGGVALAGLLCAVLWVGKPHRSAPRAKVEVLAASRLVPAQVVAITGFPPRIMPRRLGNLKMLPVSALSESDVVALEETRAPSHPAPPLPPTEQERLLTRVASQHDPEQMAVLNPKKRAEQELQANAEFRDFFEPVRLTEETPSTTTIKERGETQ